MLIFCKGVPLTCLSALRTEIHGKNHHYFSNANCFVMLLCTKNDPTARLWCPFILSINLTHSFLLVGWVGAVPHPLAGVPLTFLSAFTQGKSLLLMQRGKCTPLNCTHSTYVFFEWYSSVGYTSPVALAIMIYLA